MSATGVPVRGPRSSKYWRYVLPYIQMQPYGNDGGSERPRVRFEIGRMAQKSPDLVEKLLVHEVPCVSCGAMIRFVRDRKKGGDSRNPASRPGSHCYVAVSCAWSVTLSCSRRSAASDEYVYMRAIVYKRDGEKVAFIVVPTKDQKGWRVALARKSKASYHPLSDSPDASARDLIDYQAHRLNKRLGVSDEEARRIAKVATVEAGR